MFIKICIIIVDIVNNYIKIGVINRCYAFNAVKKNLFKMHLKCQKIKIKKSYKMLIKLFLKHQKS